MTDTQLQRTASVAMETMWNRRESSLFYIDSYTAEWIFIELK